MRSSVLRPTGVLAIVVGALTLAACGRSSSPQPGATYTPRTRELTVTTVPLLVRETASLYPFLAEDFAPGGVLDGKEVYAFSPSTLTVVEGDTIHFTFVNPEDDEHSFVLPDFTVALPGQQVTHATYIARRAGIYSFVCSIPAHLPMMWGQLVVLAPAAVASAAP
jgi:plastocyanin